MRFWGFIPFWAIHISLFLMSSIHAQQPPPALPNTLNVQVRVAGGQPPPGLVRVELFRGNMPIEEAYCDSRGDYAFVGLDQGFYAVRASLSGFQSHYEEIPLQGGVIRNVLINLRPGRDVSGRGSIEMDPAEAAGSLAVPARAREEFTQGRTLRMSEDFEGAVRRLKRAVDLEPTFALAHNELGLCYWRLGQLDEAQASFETAIEHDPSLLYPYLTLADMLAEQEAFNDAGAVLLRASEALPDRGEPFFVMAQLQIDTGHLDAAEKAARMALERDHSEIPEVHLLLANIYLRRDEPGLVAVELESYIEKAPGGDQIETARRMLMEIREDIENRTSIPLKQYTDLVESYRAGRHTATAKALSQIPGPIMMEASEAYGKRHTMDIERMSAAMLHTEAAIVLGKSGAFHLNMAIRYLAQIKNDALRRQWFITMGYYFHGKRRFLDAVPFFLDATRLSPKDIDTRLALASACEAAALTRGHPNLLEQAEKHYRTILKDAPDHAEANLRLGHILKLMGRGKDASRQINKALSVADRPDLALVAHLLLGDIHRADGDTQGAIASYRAAHEIEPQCQVAATALGHALHRAGDLDASRDVMTSLLEEKRKKKVFVDAWWRYLLGGSHNFNLMMAEMRQEVLQ